MLLRPLDLDWRRPRSRETADSATPATFTEARAALNSVELPKASAALAVSQPTAQTTHRAVALTPEVTEQLTREVVRRIERQLRIERERRGI
jgi:hypothetical protein